MKLKTLSIIVLSITLVATACKDKKNVKKNNANKPKKHIISGAMKPKGEQFWLQLEESMELSPQKINGLKKIDQQSRKELKEVKDSGQNFYDAKQANLERKLKIKQLLGDVDYSKYITLENDWVNQRRKNK